MTLRKAIIARTNDRLRDNLLKAVGEEPYVQWEEFGESYLKEDSTTVANIIGYKHEVHGYLTTWIDPDEGPVPRHYAAVWEDPRDAILGRYGNSRSLESWPISWDDYKNLLATGEVNDDWGA